MEVVYAGGEVNLHLLDKLLLAFDVVNNITTAVPQSTITR